MKYLTAAMLLMVGLTGGAQAAGDAAAGQAKSALCASCHGPDGNSVNPIWPSLAGQDAGYLAKQLYDFKTAKRTDPIMAGMAMAVQDADVENLAAYYAAQPINAGVASKPELVEKGRALYRGGDLATGLTACTACHGPNGEGNATAGFPVLASQHAPYLIKQLQMFRDGTRNNDQNGMMSGVAAKMSDADMEAVAMYLTTLN